MVSVDGYRLAKRTEPVDFPQDLSFVVPGKTLAEILRLLKDSDDPVELFAGRRHILFKIDNYTVISSLLEGEFFKLQGGHSRGQQDPGGAAGAGCHRQRGAGVPADHRPAEEPSALQFGENEVRLLCTTSMGRASDQFGAAIEGEPVEIGFNNRYLLDALRNTECDEVRVQLSGPLSPMKILPKEGDSFLFLVLPVRLKTE